MTEPEHLGGWEYNGNSDVPWLWDWLIEKFHPSSMIDIGCGRGLAAAHFLDCRVDAWGVDGSELARAAAVLPGDRFLIHDFTKGPFSTPLVFDLAWSCEFVEHVDEEFVANVLAALELGSVIAMTHALPHQTAGHHHTNLKLPCYWIEKIEAQGFKLDMALTEESRRLRPDLTECYWNWSGLIFERVRP